MDQLRVVIRAGAGYNTIDTKHARRLGVDVMNTPGANANAVAEEVDTVRARVCLRSSRCFMHVSSHETHNATTTLTR